GEVKALNIVNIAPEISGKIIKVHPRLEAGEIIKKGETLFEIDSKDYVTAVEAGRKRLKVLKRTRELAQKEYKRANLLFKENNVGTESGVDMAEKAMLSTDDLFAQVEQALTMAETNLERCKVIAQFNGRVSYVSLEKGQFVAPGQHVVTLVDDSILEINVPIDSRYARKWLRFENNGFEDNGFKKNQTWFSGLVRVPCRINWSEGDVGQSWSGQLHRIVKFDQKTRTLTAAVRVDSKNIALEKTKRFPLVEGMFCSVRIPGKTLKNVIRLPRLAVSYKNSVYTAVNNRLKTVPVTVDYVEGGYAYISSGLNKEDVVLTTRLIDPLENALLKIMEDKNGENKS
ncbi:MAG: efflux RND transporter periplasmic adaptor subunit, partial [Deltaproteobacteria bacterium]|nr:efflux RND transporter periplasmic adaptor subunit [Deltaproteobacteria bacterium]